MKQKGTKTLLKLLEEIPWTGKKVKISKDLKKVMQLFVDFANQKFDFKEDIFLISLLDLTQREKEQIIGHGIVNLSYGLSGRNNGVAYIILVFLDSKISIVEVLSHELAHYLSAVCKLCPYETVDSHSYTLFKKYLKDIKKAFRAFLKENDIEV